MSNIKSSKIFSGLKNVLDTNAPTLATFGSILGVGLTIFFMHKASKQAAAVEEKYEEKAQYLEDQVTDGELSEDNLKDEKGHARIEKYMRLVYIYRWALISGFGSAAFALLSNYLNGRTIAALTGFVALNNERLREYAKKGKEMLGEEKFKELQDNVEKELFEKKTEKTGKIKVEGKNVSVADEKGPDEGWERYYLPHFDDCWDIPVGRANDVLAECTRMEYLSVNDFRLMFGKRSCDICNDQSWHPVYVNGKIADDSKFKAHIGYTSEIGKYGMKSIIFDNLPSYDSFGK